MGQAKNRGTFEERKAAAVVRITKETAERDARDDRRRVARANADRKAGRDTIGAGMVGAMVAMMAASSLGTGRLRT